MHKKHTLAIGFFVIGAVALTVLAVMLFGAGNLFQTKSFYTMFFDKSVNGLTKGAPVMFRGIRLGEVTDIRLSLGRKEIEHAALPGQTAVTWPIAVTVELYPNTVAIAENRGIAWYRKLFNAQKRADMEIWLDDMILTRGLRAQLQTQNFLTGLLYIELDLFHEETGDPAIRNLLANRVIPTRISAFERLYLSLNQNDFTGQINQLYTVANVIGKFFTDGKAQHVLDSLVTVSDTLRNTLEHVHTLCRRANSPEGDRVIGSASELIISLHDSARNLNALLEKFNRDRTDRIIDQTLVFLEKTNAVIRDVHTFVSPEKPVGKLIPFMVTSVSRFLATAVDVIGQLRETAEMVKPAVADARQLIRRVDTAVEQLTQPIPALTEQLTRSLAELDRTAAQAAALLADARATIRDDAPVMRELDRTLQDTRKAADAIRALAELLEQQPEALLRGRR